MLMQSHTVKTGGWSLMSEIHLSVKDSAENVSQVSIRVAQWEATSLALVILGHRLRLDLVLIKPSVVLSLFGFSRSPLKPPEINMISWLALKNLSLCLCKLNSIGSVLWRQSHSQTNNRRNKWKQKTLVKLFKKHLLLSSPHCQSLCLPASRHQIGTDVNTGLFYGVCCISGDLVGPKYHESSVFAAGISVSLKLFVHLYNLFPWNW